MEIDHMFSTLDLPLARPFLDQAMFRLSQANHKKLQHLSCTLGFLDIPEGGVDTVCSERWKEVPKPAEGPLSLRLGKSNSFSYSMITVSPGRTRKSGPGISSLKHRVVKDPPPGPSSLAGNQGVSNLEGPSHPRKH